MDTEATLKKARYLVLRLLTYRARSRKEVSDYLERKGFPENVIEPVIKEIEKYGYINDERFADDFIVYRKLRGYGALKVRYELNLKGIDNQIIEQKTSEHFNPEEDLARIKEILENRNSKKANVEEYDERWLKREAGFLKRRGFQDNLILTALKGYYDPAE